MIFESLDPMLKEALWIVFCIACYGSAGAGVFLVLFSRVLLQIEDGPGKRILIYVSFAGLLALILWASLFAPAVWLVVPAVILVALFAGEIRRHRIRAQCRGAKPVELISPTRSLLRPLTTYDLTYARYEVRLPSWQGARLRIAHISDLHVNRCIPQQFYRDVLRRVEECRPDLLFMTGDFITRADALPLFEDVLSHIPHPRLGTFAILGNHDHWTRPREIVNALQTVGVRVLHHDSVSVETGSGSRVVVAGCELPWAPSEWHPPQAAPDTPLLVLTHTADNIYLLNQAGAAMAFAGHYHGGQAAIPWFGSVVIPSRYGRRFDHGHFVVNGTHLFVTSGVGAAVPPFRIYCHPEVLAVDLIGTGEDLPLATPTAGPHVI